MSRDLTPEREAVLAAAKEMRAFWTAQKDGPYTPQHVEVCRAVDALVEAETPKARTMTIVFSRTQRPCPPLILAGPGSPYTGDLPLEPGVAREIDAILRKHKLIGEET